MIAWLLLAGLPCVPLALTLVNVATWRRPAGGAVTGTVSVLIPARNEVAVIERCLRAVLREPALEVLVYDDGSTDGTGDVVRRLSSEDPRVRLVVGTPLPAGWIGKPHALHQLAKVARGDHLLFVDADTTLEPGALGALLSVAADVTSALPRQVIGSLGEALIVPMLNLTYASFLPLELVARVRSARVCAVNGQVLLVTRAAYDAIGGFESVRSEVVDDMAFCRRAKRLGRRVAFVDGFALASCRMYTSFDDAFRGFSKNLYEGVGGTPPALVAVMTLYGACFLLPWVLLPFHPAAAVGVLANLTQRALLARRYDLPWSSVVTHPVGVIVFFAIGVNSLVWARNNTIGWRGRTYAARSVRGIA